MGKHGISAYYAVYDSADRIVAFGRAPQCARMLGCKTLNSFYSLVVRTQQGKLQKYGAVVIDRDEEVRAPKGEQSGF